MPDTTKLTALALRTLEDVLAQANHGPVEPQWGHRVALAWLAQINAGLKWHYGHFWIEMQRGHEGWDVVNSSYVRTTALIGLLDHWYLKLGLVGPDNVQRGHWAKRYHPDIDSDSGTTQLPCMCNRYQPGDRHVIRNLFGARQLREVNDGPATVHPKEPGWVIYRQSAERVLEQMTWGFPVVLRGKQGQLLKPKPVNNARFDKLGAFWKRWAVEPANRCLIPATRYAEAAGVAGQMTETWLSVKDQPVFAWAGLWRPSDEWGNCYTGVMTDNAPELANIHDRSPVIIDPADWDTWLTAPFEELAQFDRPYPAAAMEVDATQNPWVHRKKPLGF